MGLLFCGIYELHVMPLSVSFHILPSLVVNIVPVLQFPLSAAVWQPSHHIPFCLSMFVVFLLHGKIFERDLNCRFWAVAGRARSPVAAVNQAVNPLGKIFLTYSNWAAAVYQYICGFCSGLSALFSLCCACIFFAYHGLFWDVLELIFSWVLPGFHSHCSL